MALLGLGLVLLACGGKESGAPVDAGQCDQAQAIADYRAAHGQTLEVGAWTVDADCMVTQVLPERDAGACIACVNGADQFCTQNPTSCWVCDACGPDMCAHSCDRSAVAERDR